MKILKTTCWWITAIWLKCRLNVFLNKNTIFEQNLKVILCVYTFQQNIYLERINGNFFFLNMVSQHRVFLIALMGVGVRVALNRTDFFTGWWEPHSNLFKLFSKLKAAFCEYWTSIKIKISMTCVYKEYEIRTKMVQKQWLQLKMKFWGGVLIWKLLFSWEELTFGGGIKVCCRWSLLGKGMSTFLRWMWGGKI